jgi:hypothetical protein
MGEFEFSSTLIRPEGVGTWTYLDIPVDISKEFGAKGQVRVKGFINGYAHQTSTRPHGDGRHYIVVNKSIRDAIDVSTGDVVHVIMELDTSQRSVVIPLYFKRVLDSDDKYVELFSKLSYSRQKEFVDWLESAKKEETRTRRMTQSIEMLLEGSTPKKRKKYNEL